MAIPEIWSDLHHNLDIDAQGSLRKVINIDAVKTSIDNILRTRRGERVMRPTFGAGLSDLVFEPTDETYFNDLADQIRNSITIWDNRVIVQTVSFIVDADHSTIIVKMIFAIRGYEQIFEHSTNLTGV